MIVIVRNPILNRTSFYVDAVVEVDQDLTHVVIQILAETNVDKVSAKPHKNKVDTVKTQKKKKELPEQQALKEEDRWSTVLFNVGIPLLPTTATFATNWPLTNPTNSSPLLALMLLSTIAM